MEKLKFGKLKAEMKMKMKMNSGVLISAFCFLFSAFAN